MTLMVPLSVFDNRGQYQTLVCNTAVTTAAAQILSVTIPKHFNV